MKHWLRTYVLPAVWQYVWLGWILTWLLSVLFPAADSFLLHDAITVIAVEILSVYILSQYIAAYVKCIWRQQQYHLYKQRLTNGHLSPFHYHGDNEIVKVWGHKGWHMVALWYYTVGHGSVMVWTVDVFNWHALSCDHTALLKLLNLLNFKQSTMYYIFTQPSV